MRPVKMSLLNISLHKSEVPAFLNEAPKFPHFHIREIKQSSTGKRRGSHHARHEKNIISDEREIINEKMTEIEENLIYLFNELEINPDKVPLPEEEDKFLLEVENLPELVDFILEKTDHFTRKLKGLRNDLVRYQEDYDRNLFLIKILDWIKLYDFKKEMLSWFDKLSFGLYVVNPANFSAIELAIDNEELSRVIQSSKLNSKQQIIFIICLKNNFSRINEIIMNSGGDKIEELEKFLPVEGFNNNVLLDDCDFCQDRIKRAKKLIDEMKENKLEFRAYLETLDNLRNYVTMEEQFFTTQNNQIVHFDAFVPTVDEEEVSRTLIKRFSTKIKIQAQPIARDVNEGHEHEDDKGEKKEKINVPSLVIPVNLLKPFKLLVDLYGTTSYNELDPTPIVAITYPLLFGLMFGDIGHGIVLIGLGLLLALSQIKHRESTMYDFGWLMVWLGVAAMLGGLVYGEIFGHHLHINGEEFMLYANPLQDIKKVLKLAILVGVVHLNIGWLLSVINFIAKKRFWLAFDPFFKIVLLSCGTYLIFHWGFAIMTWLSPPYPILLALAPALGLVVMKPIGKLIFRAKYLKHETVGALIGESALDLIETYLSILSNVASYSRLLALGMAHMGLMLIVTTLVEMSGNPWTIPIILIAGNAIVIALEGLLAAIHALRLHLYEFFGKFYLADGIAYQGVNIKSEYSKIIFASL